MALNVTIPFPYPATGYADADKTGENFAALLKYLNNTSGGAGHVSVGSQYQLAYYATAGNAVSGNPLFTQNAASGLAQIGLSAPTGFTATATTGGAVAAGTYYYSVYAITSTSIVGYPTAKASVTIGGANNATQLSWSAVTGATGYRVTRTTVQDGCDGYWEVSTTSYKDVDAAFTATGNPYAAYGARWFNLAGSLVMPASSGQIRWLNFETGSLDGFIAQTSAGEIEYRGGSSGLAFGDHVFEDGNDATLLTIHRATRSDPTTGVRMVWAGSGGLKSVQFVYNTEVQFCPNDVQVGVYDVRGISVPTGSATNPGFSFEGERNTGLYRASASQLAVTLGGTQYYNFLSTQYSPGTDGGQDLGSTTARWRNIYNDGALVDTKTSDQIVLGTTRTVTITAPTPATASRTVTIPDLAASYSVVGTEGTQTINGSKTFSSTITGTTSGNANTALSNLASVAINTALLPGTDNSIDLGSSSKRWVNLFAKDIAAGDGTAGTAGSVNITPGTASKGKISITATASAGDTTTSITNASQAGARTYTIPDAGASANFVMSEGTATINGSKTFGSPVLLPDGSASATAWAFSADSGNGAYRIGTDNWALSAANAKIWETSSAGHITQPLQASFLVTDGTGASNVTGDGTVYTQLWPTEVFDQGSNFASNTFTAPVTGRYLLTVNVMLDNLLAAHTGRELRLVTSNRDYRNNYNFLLAETDHSMDIAVIADMDENDTATVTLVVSGSTKTVDIDPDARFNFFSGSLIN